MIAIVHHLQQIMVTENVMLGELVGCAEIVRGSYGRFNDIGQSSIALPSRCSTSPALKHAFSAGEVEQRAK
ncbi:hypothetical protein MUB10_29340 [Klebsiella variicola]|nr:hypothetical protein [Klebsiella variicola]MCJ1958986.1 hypothetical protein [Klebsiella variicola]